ncbi:hypothetical protein COY17_01570 [Candidatus Saccharibacteria bacterium CG_4_10_14_0_2_um_filter_52_9]|nr:MAG: hypothetical protein COY17_01570 [Candidatus Saccharibacteria bacterium CG_4_10_14_0_2_um_filter_52_9]
MRITSAVKVGLTGFAALVVLMSLTTAGASSANISRSYHSTVSITNGSILSLDPSKTDYVLPANTDNGSRLLGIAVGATDSLLAVDATEGAVQVATSGTATVLVSGLNGPIKAGDQIAVSPFSGVGMKALPGSHYIGLAQTAFSDKSQGATTQNVVGKDGKTSQLHIGYVKVSIVIGVNNTGTGNQQLNTLQRLGKSISGHPVSNVRIILSMLVAGIALLVLITLIYASIYGSIISVGRNPLAKHAIFRTLGSVLGMVILTAITATALIVFLLR